MAVRGETLSLVLPLLFSCQTSPRAPCVTLISSEDTSRNQVVFSVRAVTRDSESGFSRSLTLVAQSSVKLTEIINAAAINKPQLSARGELASISLFAPTSCSQFDSQLEYAAAITPSASPQGNQEAGEPAVTLGVQIGAQRVGNIKTGGQTAGSKGGGGQTRTLTPVMCSAANVSVPCPPAPPEAETVTVSPGLPSTAQSEPSTDSPPSFALANVSRHDLGALDGEAATSAPTVEPSAHCGDSDCKLLPCPIDSAPEEIKCSPTISVIHGKGTVATEVERINKHNPIPPPLLHAVDSSPPAATIPPNLPAEAQTEANASPPPSAAHRLIRLTLTKISAYQSMCDALAARKQQYDSSHLSRQARDTIHRLEQVIDAQTTRIHQLCGLQPDPIRPHSRDDSGGLDSTTHSAGGGTDVDRGAAPELRQSRGAPHSGRSILAAARRATGRSSNQPTQPEGDGVYSEAVTVGTSSLRIAELSMLLRELLVLYETEVGKTQHAALMASAAVFDQCAGSAEMELMLAELIASKMRCAELAEELEECRNESSGLRLEIQNLRRAQPSDTFVQSQSAEGANSAQSSSNSLALEREFSSAISTAIPAEPTAVAVAQGDSTAIDPKGAPAARRPTIKPALKPLPLISPASGNISKFQINNDDTSPQSSEEDMWM